MVFMEKFYHLLRFKCIGIFSHNSLRAAEPRQDIVFYEIHYHFFCSPLGGYGLDPLYEVISGSQNPLVLSGGVWIYLTDEVLPLLLEWSLHRYGVERERHHLPSSFKDLTLVTLCGFLVNI